MSVSCVVVSCMMASVIIITSSRVSQILDEKMTDMYVAYECVNSRIVVSEIRGFKEITHLRHSQGMVFDLPHASLFHSRSSSFHDDDDDDDVSTPST